MKIGLVLRSAGMWYDILDESEKKIYQGRLRGNIRLKGIKATNPVAVGDYVRFTPESTDSNVVIIKDIEERKNYIVRQSIHKKEHGHIIAANIDQAIVLATLKMPATSMGFIDRFLVTAETFRIPSILIFNKSDLLNEAEKELQHEVMQLYERIGYRCVSISALYDEDLNVLKEILSDKKSLVSGHSGVGKSTLLNRLAPHIQQKTNIISDFSNKGTHTTTFAEMFEVFEGSYLIDTPGIKEFGLVDIQEEELSHYFPEMREMLGNCKYYNCKHISEPQCAVKDAVEKQEIALSRYKSYLSMLRNEDSHR